MKCEALCFLHALFGRRPFVFTDRTCVFSVVTVSFFSQPIFFPLSLPYKPLIRHFICSGSLIFRRGFFYELNVENGYNSFVLSEGVLPNSFAVCRV